MIKEIKGFEEYNITDSGLVIGKRGKPLSPSNNRGYRQVVLIKNGKKLTKKVHHLVLEAFICPRPKGMEANHKNGIKSDNRPKNLEWVTSSENKKHALANGLINRSYKNLVKVGIKHRFKPKLKPGEARLIKKLLSHQEECGLSFRKIGKMFKISHQAVSHINTGKAWINIKH